MIVHKLTALDAGEDTDTDEYSNRSRLLQNPRSSDNSKLTAVAGAGADGIWIWTSHMNYSV